VSGVNDDARQRLVANERIKFTATCANGIGVAIFAVGGFAPLVSTVLSDQPHFAPVIFIMAVCWIIIGAIHLTVRNALRDLRP